MKLIFALSIISVFVCWAGEIDYAPTSYFDASGTSISGTPPGSNPSFLYSSPSFGAYEFEQLHQYCVDRLNMYRSGALKFSDGTDDTNVQAGLTPLKHAADFYTCVSSEAMGDLVINQAGGGGCAGAHDTAFSCGMGGYQGQNSCCGRGGGSWGSWDNNNQHFTLTQVKAELDGCLQSMWDEGITAGQKGHWETMRSTTFTRAACGFAWTSAGRIMMIQDFTSSSDVCSPQACGECGSPACMRCASSDCGPTPAPTTPAPTPPTASPAPTISPAPTVAVTLAPTPVTLLPTEAEMRGACPSWGYNDHLQACDGYCWSSSGGFSHLSSIFGNGVCNDLANSWGLDVNCIRLKCDGGDCTTCSDPLGQTKNQTKTFTMLPQADPPVKDDNSSLSSLPAWFLLLLSGFLLNIY